MVARDGTVVSTLVQGERLSVIFLNATGLCGFPRQLHTCNGRAKKKNLRFAVIDGSEDDRGRASSAESVQMPAAQGGRGRREEPTAGRSETGAKRGRIARIFERKGARGCG